MEAIAHCLCSGDMYVHTLRASGTEASAWLEKFEAATRSRREQERPFLEILSTWHAARQRTPRRLDVAWHSRGASAEVVARLDHRELVLSSARKAPRGHEAWLRHATTEETFTLAARWLLGLDRFGCGDPLEDAFWFHRAQFAAYVACAPPPSVARHASRMPPWTGAFVAAIEGTEEGALRSGVVEGLQEWAAGNPESHAALGWFTGSETSAAYQIAAAIEGTDVRGGAT